MKAFWTWNPVCSGEFRRFDEPYMLHHNDWLFDREVWRSMFSRMAESGFDSMVFANTHPFPFMIRCPRFPEAGMLDDAELERYQEVYRWIMREGKAHGIETWLLFFSVYYPEPFLDHHGFHDRAAYSAGDLAIDYTRCCVEEVLKTYSDLGGIIGEASENITGPRGRFLREAVVEPFQELAAGKRLILRGWWSERDELVREVVEPARVPIAFSVKYTWEHFVHHDPDPLFTEWASSIGPENTMAEFWISNYEPLTCFAHSTIRKITHRLEALGCAGFSLHPLSMYEWPFTSDRCWTYQFDRDAAYYCGWGGQDAVPDEQRALLEDERTLSGLEAASEILKLSALYFAGDRQNQWHPQFCSVRHADCVRLLTIEDMCSMRSIRTHWSGGWWRPFDSLDWRTTFTGQPTMHFDDYDPAASGVYGPFQFAEEMERLAAASAQAVSRAEERYRTPGQRCLLKHASASALLGWFWAQRARAGIEHVAGRRAAAARHMERAIGHFSEMERIEATHREPFRILTGRCAQANNWDMPRAALELELADYRAGVTGGIYRAGITEHRDTSYHPRGMFGWYRANRPK